MMRRLAVLVVALALAPGAVRAQEASPSPAPLPTPRGATMLPVTPYVDFLRDFLAASEQLSDALPVRPAAAAREAEEMYYDLADVLLATIAADCYVDVYAEAWHLAVDMYIIARFLEDGRARPFEAMYGTILMEDMASFLDTIEETDCP